MIHYFIYAKDFSGSTEGVSYYHKNGEKTLQQFKSDVHQIKEELVKAGEQPSNCKVVYLHWGDCCYQTDEKNTLETYQNLESGRMGTEPVTIIQWLRDNNICGKDGKIKLLYIITDGMILHDSALKCIELNENTNYEKVVFHAFNEWLDCIDLSVAASFFKRRCVVYRNYELFDDVDISEEFDYDKINIGNFDAEKENLKSYIKLKFIKKRKQDSRSLNEVDKLKKLRNRLFAEWSSKPQITKINLNTKDRNAFLQQFVNTNWYRNLTSSDYDMKVNIEKCITTLINYIVSDAKSFSFDALKFEKTFNKPVEEEPIVDVNFAIQQEIEFPDVILDDEKGIPVILLSELNLLDKLIFHTTDGSDGVSSASFNKFKTAMECPLFLMTDEDIGTSIGYFYTLNVYKLMLESDCRTDPRTRRPFHGALVLLDGDEIDKYNDYILSATYFSFRKINYNVALFYYVLWKKCESKKWMDKNVLDQFKKYVMRRIGAAWCKIGLSSLPLDPQEVTTLPTALWYCLELSSCVFKDDPQNYMHERLRMFHGVAYSMIEILKYFDYDLDIETIEKRLDLIRHVMALKRIPKHLDKVYYLLKRIFKNVNGFLVHEIEKPENLHTLNYLKFDHKGMFSDDVVKETVHLSDYVHLMHVVDVDITETGTVKVCEKTLRPYFTTDQKISFYSDLFKATKRVIVSNDDDKDKIKIIYQPIDALEFDRVLSLYNLFLRCVQDLEKYPTLSDYMEYIIKRKKYNANLITIFPPDVCESIAIVYKTYQSIVTKVDLKKFIETYQQYVGRKERIKAEEILNCNDDSEIDKFIASEEVEVNLIRKQG